jgi:hypothetical protein
MRASSKNAMVDQVIKTARDMQGDRLIQGYASSSSFNSHGYSLRAAGCFAKLPVPVLWAHDHHHQIGEVTALIKSDQLIEVRCEIYRTRAADEIWKEIEAGRALSFSGGTNWKNTSRELVMKEGAVHTDWELKEVSVCYRGANPDSVFRIVRNRSESRPVRIDVPKKGVVRLHR